MNHRAIWNRVVHWGFTAILTTACVLSARHMQSLAADLDELIRERRQALQSLRATQAELAERRGRHEADSPSLAGDIRSALADPAIKLLIPGLSPVPSPTHAGLLIQLVPADGSNG